MVIAINVLGRAKVQFKDHPNIPMALKEAASNAFSKSTVQRILDAKVGTSLEQLDSLAKALDLQPYQLLMDNLDPNNPQVARGALAEERELYRKIAREEVQDLLASSPGLKPPRKS